MDNLNDIYEKLGRIEGTQKLMLDEMRQGFNRINGTIEKHSYKIDRVENDIITLKTKSAFLGAGAGMGIMILWEIIKNKVFK